MHRKIINKYIAAYVTASHNCYAVFQMLHISFSLSLPACHLTILQQIKNPPRCSEGRQDPRLSVAACFMLCQRPPLVWRLHVHKWTSAHGASLRLFISRLLLFDRRHSVLYKGIGFSYAFVKVLLGFSLLPCILCFVHKAASSLQDFVGPKTRMISPLIRPSRSSLILIGQRSPESCLIWTSPIIGARAPLANY